MTLLMDALCEDPYRINTMCLSLRQGVHTTCAKRIVWDPKDPVQPFSFQLLKHFGEGGELGLVQGDSLNLSAIHLK